jgi:hypothetical protein
MTDLIVFTYTMISNEKNLNPNGSQFNNLEKMPPPFERRTDQEVESN